MDFLKLLRSLEEFLYELCTWFVFFPRTLWRVVTQPRRTLAYVDRELGEDIEHRFDDAISPPMFLMLAVLVAHGVELLMQETVEATNALSHNILDNEEGLLLYRSLTFAIWPLVMAVHVLWRKREAVTRESMRRPFFMQCYLAAPFAMALSTAMVFVRMPGAVSTWWGLGAAALASLWYLVVQARWLHVVLGKSWPNTVLSTLWVLALGMTINSVIGFALLAPGLLAET